VLKGDLPAVIHNYFYYISKQSAPSQITVTCAHICVCCACVCAACLLLGVIIWPGHIYTHSCFKPRAHTWWDPCIYIWLFLPWWKQMHAAQTVISYPLQASCVFHGQIQWTCTKLTPSS
jgi:hypothetical protein